MDGVERRIHSVREIIRPHRISLPNKPLSGSCNCRNAAALEWIFAGRWLFLDKTDDARFSAIGQARNCHRRHLPDALSPLVEHLRIADTDLTRRYLALAP